MIIDEAFPSAYLNAGMLNGATPTLKIDRVEMHTFDPEGEKPVLYFSGKDSGLVLNKTRAMACKALFGADTDSWKGQSVKLGCVPVNVNGKMLDSITLNKAESNGSAEKKAQPKKDVGYNVEDDVPF